jgi:large subunit ribosomal protein L28
LQKVRIQEGAATKRAWVCASCLKGFKVQKAQASSPVVESA